MEQMLIVADALLQAGNHETAAGLYRALAAQHPTAPRLRARVAMAERPRQRSGPMLQVQQILEKLHPGAYVGEGIATWFKAQPFMNDRRFTSLAQELAPLSPNVLGWHWNLYVALWAAMRARRLPGDFVELGVFKGHTTLFVSEYLGFGQWPKRWWLYDTFEGVPQDQLEPGRGEVNAGAYAGRFSFEEVRDRFAHFANITVIQGRAPEILQETAPQAVSFLHVDLNNSTAEVASLELLWPRLCPGGVVLLDDFGWSVSKAQFEAETRWFAERGEQVLTLPTGQGLVIKQA